MQGIQPGRVRRTKSLGQINVPTPPPPPPPAERSISPQQVLPKPAGNAPSFRRTSLVTVVEPDGPEIAKSFSSEAKQQRSHSVTSSSNASITSNTLVDSMNNPAVVVVPKHPSSARLRRASASDLTSLISARKQENAKAARELLQSKDNNDILTMAWKFALFAGDDFFQNRLSSSKCDAWIVDVFSPKGVCSDLRRLRECYELAVESQTSINYEQFLQVLIHIAGIRYPMETPKAGMTKLVEAVISPWVEESKVKHTVDGLAPTLPPHASPQDIILDNLVYAYETPLRVIFDRYKAIITSVDTKTTFEDIQNQKKGLEVLEAKALLTDIGIFPACMSYNDLLRIMAVMNGIEFGRTSLREKLAGVEMCESESEDEGDCKSESASVCVSVKSGASGFGGVAMEQLSLMAHQMPEFVIRLGLVAFSNSANFPTIPSRVEYVLREAIGKNYGSVTGRTLAVDVDSERKPPPTLSKLAPDVLAIGDIETEDIVLQGIPFCEKRGVYVKFMLQSHKIFPQPEMESVIVRAHVIKAKYVKVRSPLVPLTLWNVTASCVNFEKVVTGTTKPRNVNLYEIKYNPYVILRIEASNNGREYSDSSEPKLITLNGDVASLTLDETVASKLHRMFLKACTSNGDTYNLNSLKKEKWDLLLETIMGPSCGEHPDVFHEHAEVSMVGMASLGLSFLGFLQALAQLFLCSDRSVNLAASFESIVK